jgi:hypothetical protein
MKHLLVVLGIGFALSFCNLANKLHGNKTNSNSSSGNSSSSSSGSSDSGGAVAEHGQANAAQAAAIAGGPEIKWEQQGMSWTVPQGWTESSKESKSFMWRSPGGSDAASLIVNISPMPEDFPIDISINANYESAKTRAKNGEIDELKWVEIDGLKGVQFREAKPEQADGIRRLQWLAFRKYAGQVQMVNLMLATSGQGYERHKDAMYGVLYSTKLVH